MLKLDLSDFNPQIIEVGATKYLQVEYRTLCDKVLEDGNKAVFFIGLNLTLNLTSEYRVL